MRPNSPLWITLLLLGSVPTVLADEPAASATPAGPVLHLVSIGVARYADAGLNLQFCDRDADEFANTLVRQSSTLYTGVRKTVLVNRDASAAGVLETVGDVQEAADADDTVVLFFSGHGGVEDKAGFYLATYEANVDDLANSTLRWTHLEAVLQELKARQLLVFIDACQAGGAIGLASGADKMASGLSQHVNTMIFCSSRGNEDSIELPKQRHGAFTAAFLDGLRVRGARANADADGNGQVTLGELRDYVPVRVRAITKGAQNPTRPSLGGCDPNAVLVLTPATVSA